MTSTGRNTGKHFIATICFPVFNALLAFLNKKKFVAYRFISVTSFKTSSFKSSSALLFKVTMPTKAYLGFSVSRIFNTLL
jgi:hypothetical protein